MLVPSGMLQVVLPVRRYRLTGLPGMTAPVSVAQ